MIYMELNLYTHVNYTPKKDTKTSLAKICKKIFVNSRPGPVKAACLPEELFTDFSYAAARLPKACR
jgi:hypothetical protein